MPNWKTTIRVSHQKTCIAAHWGLKQIINSIYSKKKFWSKKQSNIPLELAFNANNNIKKLKLLDLQNNAIKATKQRIQNKIASSSSYFKYINSRQNIFYGALLPKTAKLLENLSKMNCSKNVMWLCIHKMFCPIDASFDFSWFFIFLRSRFSGI